jgi:hypothetical protein
MLSQFTSNIPGYICLAGSELYIKLVAQLGYTRDQTQGFSSPEFIFKAYEGHENEAGHASLRPMAYQDFVTQETKPTAVFGTQKVIRVRDMALKLIRKRDVLFNKVRLS